MGLKLKRNKKHSIVVIFFFHTKSKILNISHCNKIGKLRVFVESIFKMKTRGLERQLLLPSTPPCALWPFPGAAIIPPQKSCRSFLSTHLTMLSPRPSMMYQPPVFTSTWPNPNTFCHLKSSLFLFLYLQAVVTFPWVSFLSELHELLLAKSLCFIKTFQFYKIKLKSCHSFVLEDKL